MIHGVGVGGTRRLKIGLVTSPTSPEALAPTPQKEHRPQSEPSHLLSLSWEHREVAPITPCSSRDRAGLCSPATLSGMWPDGPRCACHTRGPASVCTRRLQTGHHSSFQSQCPHAPHTTAETASNWTCAFITHGPFPPISTPSRQPRSFQPTAASLPITRSVLWVQDPSRPAPLPDCFLSFFFLSFYSCTRLMEGGSQARGCIRAVVTGLHHSSQQRRILNPLIEARD